MESTPREPRPSPDDPDAMSDADPTHSQPPELNDRFHHGVITKLFPSNNTGFVRIESGREVAFAFDFVVLVGAAQSVRDLREGETVGYDLGWTPTGLQVTKIKTYGPAGGSGRS